MNAKVFLATQNKGIIRALVDANAEWSIVFPRIEHQVYCLAADPRDSNVVYAGTQGNGLLRSTDRGDTWQPAGLEGQNIRAIAVSPIEPGTVYVGTKPVQLFVSRDSGATWTELESIKRKKRWFWHTPAEEPMSAFIQGLALSPTDPNVIVVGIELGAVLRSGDGGQTWDGHKKGAIRDCHSLIFHPTDGNWIYEGGGGGASFSQDGGITWRQPTPFRLWEVTTPMLRYILSMPPPKPGRLDRFYGWAVAADPAEPNIWYLSSSTGPYNAHDPKMANALAYIFRCQDGENWEPLAGGLPQPLNYMPYALITDPQAPGHLYAGLSNGDVWFSADHGNTWTQLPFNLRGIERAMLMLT